MFGLAFKFELKFVAENEMGIVSYIDIYNSLSSLLEICIN